MSEITSTEEANAQIGELNELMSEGNPRGLAPDALASAVTERAAAVITYMLDDWARQINASQLSTDDPIGQHAMKTKGADVYGMLVEPVMSWGLQFMVNDPGFAEGIESEWSRAFATVTGFVDDHSHLQGESEG